MRITSFIMCAMAVALMGCKEQGYEQRLVDMAVELEKNSAQIRELSLTLEGINTRLGSMEHSFQTLAKESADLRQTTMTSASTPPVDNVGGGDFQNMSRQVTVLAQELASIREEMASTKEVLEKTERLFSKPHDPVEVMHGLLDKPDEFAQGLDKLLENASARIEDPASRQNFEAEVMRLRDRVLSGSSPGELYQELQSRHLEKLNAVKDETDRQAIQREISNLENCSEEELRKRLSEYGRDRTVDEFFRIVKSYGVRKEDLVGSFPALLRKK